MEFMVHYVEYMHILSIFLNDELELLDAVFLSYIFSSFLSEDLDYVSFELLESVFI